MLLNIKRLLIAILFVHAKFAMAGQNVGGGLDWRIKIRQAQLYVEDYIRHLDIERLPRYASKEVLEFLRSAENRTKLADDIKYSEHDAGVIDVESLEGHDAVTAFTSRALVKWSKAHLEQMDSGQVRRTLIHETMHHLGYRDSKHEEKFADDVAAILESTMPGHDPYFRMVIGFDTKRTITDRYLFFWKTGWCETPGAYVGALYHLSSSTWIPVRKPAQFFTDFCRHKPQVTWLGGNKVVVFGSNDVGPHYDKSISGFTLDTESGLWTAFDTGIKYPLQQPRDRSFYESILEEPNLFVFKDQLQIWFNLNLEKNAKEGRKYNADEKNLTKFTINFPFSDGQLIPLKAKDHVAFVLIDGKTGSISKWWRYDHNNEMAVEIKRKSPQKWRFYGTTSNQLEEPYTFESEGYLIFTETLEDKPSGRVEQLHFMSTDGELISGPIIADSKLNRNKWAAISAFGHILIDEPILVYHQYPDAYFRLSSLHAYNSETKSWHKMERTNTPVNMGLLQILPDGRLLMLSNKSLRGRGEVGQIYDFKEKTWLRILNQ